MEEKKVLVRNNYGVAIVKCCASCRFKKMDARYRVCVKGEGLVASSWVCDKWEMSVNFQNAGKGNGSVKKGSYLQYCLDCREKYKEMPLLEIRAEYIKKNGSIYLIHEKL